MAGEDVIVASDRVLGNGAWRDIADVIYVKPDTFNARHTRQIAQELEKINWGMLEDGLPHLLIFFGRLGSIDPWLGVPVNWGQISGARVIVETTVESLRVELSQGSHFFLQPD